MCLGLLIIEVSDDSRTAPLHLAYTRGTVCDSPSELRTAGVRAHEVVLVDRAVEGIAGFKNHSQNDQQEEVEEVDALLALPEVPAGIPSRAAGTTEMSGSLEAEYGRMWTSDGRGRVLRRCDHRWRLVLDGCCLIPAPCRYGDTC